jgi:hypothetical protein
MYVSRDNDAQVLEIFRHGQVARVCCKNAAVNANGLVLVNGAVLLNITTY